MGEPRSALEILEEALKLPPDQRKAFVEDQSGGDAAMCSELLDALRADPLPPLAGEAAALGAGLLRAIRESGPAVVDATPEAVELLRLLTRSSASFDRYQLHEELGSGAMGLVHRADDRQLRRTVAIKFLKRSIDSDSEAAAGPSGGMDVGTGVLRFLQEAQITSQLEHPGILPVYELGVTPTGELFYTMPCVGRERTLQELLTRQEDGMRPGVAELVQIVVRAAEAIAFAHSRGVLHRDIKPANVLLGEFGSVYVTDWGVAKLLGAEQPLDDGPDVSTDVGATHGGGNPGTENYLAPERVIDHRCEWSTKADVYGVGALLYEVLSGIPPYSDQASRSRDSVRALVANGGPTPLEQLVPTTPRDLRAICEKAMRRDPAERYESLSDLLADLRAFLEHRVVSADRGSVTRHVTKWVRRNPVLSGFAGLALVVVIVAFGVGQSVVRAASRRAADVRELAMEWSGVSRSLRLHGFEASGSRTNLLLDGAVVRFERPLTNRGIVLRPPPGTGTAEAGTLLREYVRLGRELGWEEPIVEALLFLTVCEATQEKPNEGLLLSVASALDLVRGQAGVELALDWIGREDQRGLAANQIWLTSQFAAERDRRARDWYWLGEMLIVNRLVEPARAAFSRCVELGSDDLNEHARFLMTCGGSASIDARFALLSEDPSEAWIYLARGYLRATATALSQECIDRAFHVAPSAAVEHYIWILLGADESLGELADVVRHARPPLEKVHLVGVALKGRQLNKEAIEFNYAAREVYPDAGKLGYNLGAYLRRDGRSDAAREVFEDVVRRGREPIARRWSAEDLIWMDVDDKDWSSALDRLADYRDLLDAEQRTGVLDGLAAKASASGADPSILARIQGARSQRAPASVETIHD